MSYYEDREVVSRRLKELREELDKLHSTIPLEPIRKVWIHDEGFAASRLSMMRIMARRTKATVVRA